MQTIRLSQNVRPAIFAAAGIAVLIGFSFYWFSFEAEKDRISQGVESMSEEISGGTGVGDVAETAADASESLAFLEDAGARNAGLTVAAPCPISGKFPIEPSAKAIPLPESFSAKVAVRYNAIYRNGFARIDCYQIPPEAIFGVRDPTKILSEIAIFDGVKNEGLSSVIEPVPHFRMLASKTVGDVEVFSEYHLFLTSQSTILVLTAAPKQSFPTEAGTAFLESLKVLH